MVDARTVGSGDTYRIERVYLHCDHAYGFTHDYNGPYWRPEWWAQVPISKRGAQLRDTRDSERRDDFAPADKGGPGKALPESRSINANSQAIQGRGGGSVERESTGNLRNTIAQFGAQTRVGRKR